MSRIVLSTMIAGAAFAGFMGSQLAGMAQTGSAKVTTPASSSDDDNMSPNPVVIELFTSQGCSSCPPADMLAKRLAKDDSLLVMTRPVTYWDRLGWKDTLARPENTALQRAYANKGNAGSGVYTPQIVVNGGDGAVGSRENDIRTLVRQARRVGPSISTELAGDGTVSVTIDGRSHHMAAISLVALSSAETVRIGRGENGGRTLSYTNVVKDERNIGSWRGEPMSLTVPQEQLRVAGADKYAIVLRRPGAGRIIGAKLLDI